MQQERYQSLLAAFAVDERPAEHKNWVPNPAAPAVPQSFQGDLEMLKHGILMGLCFLAAMSTSVAGHHHFPLFFGHHHSHASVYPVAGPVYYPYAAPVYYRAPATVYQSAYVVPTAAVSVVAPPVATVRYHSYYAPSVPIYSTAGYYYAPRTTYLRPSIGYGWVSRPRDVEVELKYRRDGSYRYEVDYD